MQKEIDQFLKKKQAELLKFSRELVKINSVNGNEREVAEVIAALLDRYDIRSKLVGKSKSRKTIVADIGRGNTTVMLNGHLDTVPLGDLSKWKYHPLSAKIVRGRMYGRGTFDMKCSNAALCFAAIALKECGFKGMRIRLVFNYDEEGGHHEGIRDVIKRGIDADACIVGEYSPKDCIRIGARGIYRFELISHGTAGHTAYRRKGTINAVTKMAKLLTALDRATLTHTRNAGFAAPIVTPGTMIRGGVAVNCFPDECSALVDCRLTLGQTLRQVRRDIKKCLATVCREDKSIRYSIKEIGFLPAYKTSARDPIVRCTHRAMKDVFGKSPRLQIGGGASDGNLLSEAGIPCIQVGVLGANAHAENEYAELASLYAMPKVYARVVMHLAKVD